MLCRITGYTERLEDPASSGDAVGGGANHERETRNLCRRGASTLSEKQKYSRGRFWSTPIDKLSFLYVHLIVRENHYHSIFAETVFMVFSPTQIRWQAFHG
jgi:hypothetical protein